MSLLVLKYSQNKNIHKALNKISNPAIINSGIKIFHKGKSYIFFGKKFGDDLNGTVLKLHPKTDNIVSIFKNRNFQRDIKRELKVKNRHQ